MFASHLYYKIITNENDNLWLAYLCNPNFGVSMWGKKWLSTML